MRECRLISVRHLSHGRLDVHHIHETELSRASAAGNHLDDMVAGTTHTHYAQIQQHKMLRSHALVPKTQNYTAGQTKFLVSIGRSWTEENKSKNTYLKIHNQMLSFGSNTFASTCTRSCVTVCTLRFRRVIVAMTTKVFNLFAQRVQTCMYSMLYANCM